VDLFSGALVKALLAFNPRQQLVGYTAHGP